MILRRVGDDNDLPTERGTYRRVREYWSGYMAQKNLPNTFWAEVLCPGCGRLSLVGINHTVATGGVVHPSYVCPHAPCTFHEFVRLDDWDHPSTTRRSPNATGDL